MAQAWAKSFYNSKQWQDTREYVLKRDKYRCQLCGAMAEEVHHKEWLKEDNINDPMITVNPDNLISLCYKCHKEQHKRKRHKRKQKELFKTNDYEFDENGNIIPPGGA